MGHGEKHFHDEAPSGAALTSYDRDNMTLYMRLLDAERSGAQWEDIIKTLFDLDPESDEPRYRHMYETHLARAKWMSEHGYKGLLRE